VAVVLLNLQGWSGKYSLLQERLFGAEDWMSLPYSCFFDCAFSIAVILLIVVLHYNFGM